VADVVFYAWCLFVASMSAGLMLGHRLFCADCRARRLRRG
jgi:hypothetical protein